MSLSIKARMQDLKASIARRLLDAAIAMGCTRTATHLVFENDELSDLIRRRMQYEDRPLGISERPIVPVGGVVAPEFTATWLMHEGCDRLPFDEASEVAASYVARIKPGPPILVRVCGDFIDPRREWPLYLHVKFRETAQ